MLAGVTIVDPAATVIDVDVEIGQDTVIEPFTTHQGRHEDRRAAASCATPTCVDCVRRGRRERRPVRLPASRRRVLRAGAKAGTFVEVKNSDIGAGRENPAPLLHRRRGRRRAARTSARRRSPPTTTARAKHRTTIGKRRAHERGHVARRAGDASATTPAPAAGSVITEDVPAGRARRSRASARRTSRATRERRRGSRHDRSPRATSTLRSEMSAMDTRTQSSRASLPIDYNKRLMLFSGRANPQLAVDIADKLGVDLGPVTLKTFSNGEVYCRYEESIRGADVFIVQSTCGNPQTGVTANDSLMELLFMIDAAVGASAHRVIAVTPWFGYSRQDKKSAPREPISARLVARMLEAAGADRVLTMDLHAGQIQGFFQKPVDHMTALFMLTQYFADLGLLGPRRRRAGRRPGQAEQEVRLEDRRRAGDPRQGAPGPAGRRDRLRDRRRARQDGGDRRRHDRHRRDAEGGRQDGAGGGRRARLRGRHARRLLRRRVREPAAPRASRRSSSPTRSRSAPIAPRTSACCPARSC